MQGYSRCFQVNNQHNYTIFNNSRICKPPFSIFISSVLLGRHYDYIICTPQPKVSHSYDVITDYAEGVPVELSKHDWFYGKISREHAAAELSLGNGNKFLVSLLLTSKVRGWVQHTAICYNPEGYCLEGKDKHFNNIADIIEYYQKFPIDEKNLQVLGMACDRTTSGTIICCKMPSEEMVQIVTQHCLLMHQNLGVILCANMVAVVLLLFLYF